MTAVIVRWDNTGDDVQLCLRFFRRMQSGSLKQRFASNNAALLSTESIATRGQPRATRDTYILDVMIVHVFMNDHGRFRK